MCVVDDDWTPVVQHKSHLLMTTFTNKTGNVRWEQYLKTHYCMKFHNNISDVMTGYSEKFCACGMTAEV